MGRASARMRQRWVSAGTASVSLRDGEREPDSFRGEMERWELDSDEREDGEMKNKRMKKKKQSGIILIGVLNKKIFFFLDVCYSAHL